MSAQSSPEAGHHSHPRGHDHPWPQRVPARCWARVATSNLVTSSLTSPDPDSVLGLGSALSPAEIRAAEAAERLLEQERKDREIAKQLQVRIIK